MLPFVLILGIAGLGALMLGDALSFEALRENRAVLLEMRDSHYGVTVIGFMLAYVGIVAFSLPGATVATLTGGFLFGVFPGVLFNVTAATIGATGIFLAARWGFGQRLSSRMDASEGRIKRIKAALDEAQWSALFLIRLIPVVPFFVANLLPAFVGVSLLRFAVSTFLGIIPGGIVFTSVGASLGQVFERGDTPDLGAIFEPHILLPLLGLCALAALPVGLRMLRGDKEI